MQLVGIDVGFSKTRATSGVATLAGGVVRVGRATAARADRMRHLAPIDRAAVVAIDAPVLPGLDRVARPCERALARGGFARRCKPGFSHVPGTGLQLREAGMETAEQMAPLTADDDPAVAFPRVFGGRNVVEAFPNAFLGVCLGDEAYGAAPRFRRGQKFDWLYEQWCAAEHFERLLERAATALPATMAMQCHANRDHEERAALVCLATAACVAAGRYVAVGEPRGGHLFLPPWEMWSAWARAELAVQHRRDASLEVWIDGAVYASGVALPDAAGA